MAVLTAREVLLQHVCPALGGAIAFVMFASPLRQVLRVNRTKHLGAVNVLPYVAMACNCLAWMFYGKLTRDFYVYVSNFPGFFFGLFYTLVCAKFSSERGQDALRRILLGASVFFFALALADMAAALDAATSRQLWGAGAVAVLACYYTAPLSSLARVVATRDSSSLHLPLCVMNVVNGMLWFAYGLAIRDWFISIPNGAGAAFNAVCVGFCVAFPAKERLAERAAAAAAAGEGSAEDEDGEQQQQAGARRLWSRVARAADPGANWGVLRVQSIVRRPGEQAPVGGGGGFFDVAQMRWRSSAAAGLLRKLSSRLTGGGGGLRGGGSSGALAALRGEGSSSGAARSMRGGRGGGGDGAATMAVVTEADDAAAPGGKDVEAGSNAAAAAAAPHHKGAAAPPAPAPPLVVASDEDAASGSGGPSSSGGAGSGGDSSARQQQ